MNPACITSDCNDLAIFACSCDNSVFICANHSASHCQIEGAHQLTSLYCPIDDSTKNNLIKKHQEKRNFLIAIKKKIVTDTRDLINSITDKCNQALKKIEKEEQKIYTLIEIANEKSQVLAKDLEEFKALECYDFSMNFTIFNTSKIEDSICEYYYKDFLSSLTLVVSRFSVAIGPETTKSMIFFKRQSNILVKINIKDMTSSNKIFSNLKTMGSHAGWCPLPSGKVFHYGGQKHQLQVPLNYTLIIDPVLNTIEQKKDGPKRKYSIGLCAFYNNSVYVFGGATILGSVINDSERFSLDTNDWVSIPPMPNSSEFNCSITVVNKIFITGSRIGVMIYDPEKCTYKRSVPDTEGSKVMICDNEKLFVLHCGSLVQYDNDLWAVVSMSTCVPHDANLITYPVRHEEFIYFLLTDFILYRFNVNMKEIERVKAYKL